MFSLVCIVLPSDKPIPGVESMHHSQGNVQRWCTGMTFFPARFLSKGPSPFARGKKRQQCATKRSRKSFVLSFSHILKKRTKKNTQTNNLQATGQSLLGLFLPCVSEVKPRCSLLESDGLAESSKPGALCYFWCCLFGYGCSGCGWYQVSGIKHALCVDLDPIPWTLW